MIGERIGRYAAHEIKFNLMAVCRCRRELLHEQLAAAEARRGHILAKLGQAPQVRQGGVWGCCLRVHARLQWWCMEAERVGAFHWCNEAVQMQEAHSLSAHFWC